MITEPLQKMERLRMLLAILEEVKDSDTAASTHSIQLSQPITILALSLAGLDFSYEGKNVEKITMIGHFNYADLQEEDERLTATRFIFEFKNGEKSAIFRYAPLGAHKNKQMQAAVSLTLRRMGARSEAAFGELGEPAMHASRWLKKDFYHPEEQKFYDSAHRKVAALALENIQANPELLKHAKEQGIFIFSLGCGDGKDMEVCHEVFTQAGFQCNAIGFDKQDAAMKSYTERRLKKFSFVQTDLEDINEALTKTSLKTLAKKSKRLILVIALGSLTRRVSKGSASVLKVVQQLVAEDLVHLLIETGLTRSLLTEESLHAAGLKPSYISHPFDKDPREVANYRTITIGVRATLDETYAHLLAKSQARAQAPNPMPWDLSFSSNPLQFSALLLKKNPEHAAALRQLDLSWSCLKDEDAMQQLLALLRQFKNLQIVLISTYEPWAQAFIEALKRSPFPNGLKLLKRKDSSLAEELPTLPVPVCRALKVYRSLPHELILEVAKSPEAEPAKYMCVWPHEGFVCKREGKHAGVALPEFRASFALVVLTGGSLLALHFPCNTYSQKLAQDLKKWQGLFATEPLEKALLVYHKNHQEKDTLDTKSALFREQLRPIFGQTLTIVEVASEKGEDLLKIDLTAALHLVANDLKDQPENYANFPKSLPSQLRFYRSQAQFFTDKQYSVDILGSKKFLNPIEEKEWPRPVKEDLALLREKGKEGVKLVCQNLRALSQDKSHKDHPWALALGLGLEGADGPSNLKQYFYVLLGLMQEANREHLRAEVEELERGPSFSFG